MKKVRIAEKAIGKEAGQDSRSLVLQHAANELIFAAVGHVGSGTSTVANVLAELLASSTGGPSVTIKSHHNVGGLPERMNMKLVAEVVSSNLAGCASSLDGPLRGRHDIPANDGWHCGRVTLPRRGCRGDKSDNRTKSTICLRDRVTL